MTAFVIILVLLLLLGILGAVIKGLRTKGCCEILLRRPVGEDWSRLL
jgi:hypothetical protein